MAHSRVGRVNRALFHYVCLYTFIFFDNLNIETLKIDPCRNKTHCVDCVSLSTRLSQKLKLKDLEVVGSESQVLRYLALSLQHESLVSWKLPAILLDRKIQPLECLPNSNNRLCDSDTQNACQGVLQAGGVHTTTDTTTQEYFLKESSLLTGGPLRREADLLLSHLPGLESEFISLILQGETDLQSMNYSVQ